MKRSRVLISALAMGLAALSIGVAQSWLSDSGSIHYTITAAPNSHGTSEKVWVCKLVGSVDDPRLAEGKNPIHVSINSADAQEGFSDSHPSYLVEDDESVCHVPEADSSGPPIIEEGDKASESVTTGDVTESNPPQTEESQGQSGAISEAEAGSSDEVDVSEGSVPTSPTNP